MPLSGPASVLRRVRKAALLATLLATALAAQQDQRDRIVRRDGKELAGRVLQPSAAPDVVLLQGGKRIRVSRSEIASMDLVGDRLRAWSQRRVRQQGNPKAQWFLVEHAQSSGLPGLARAQAMLLALDDDGHDDAHRFLGHKQTSTGWLWPHDGRHLTRAQLGAAFAKEPIELVGERFLVRCDGEPRAYVAALLDLEHMGAWWFEQFGEALQFEEALRPVQVDINRNSDRFPKWGARPRPYFVPAPHGDRGHTFFGGTDPLRPQGLFLVGSMGLLYRCLIGDVSIVDSRDRVCAWLEMGLGMLAQSTFQGPAGYAAPGTPRFQDLLALQAIGRNYRINQLLHLPMYGAFHLGTEAEIATNQAAAATMVSFLLDPANVPPTRDPFLRYVRQALHDRKGDSSSAFDRVLGRSIEQLEEPWRRWLEKQAGF